MQRLPQVKEQRGCCHGEWSGQLWHLMVLIYRYASCPIPLSPLPVCVSTFHYPHSLRLLSGLSSPLLLPCVCVRETNMVILCVPPPPPFLLLCVCVCVCETSMVVLCVFLNHVPVADHVGSDWTSSTCCTWFTGQFKLAVCVCKGSRILVWLCFSQGFFCSKGPNCVWIGAQL